MVEKIKGKRSLKEIVFTEAFATLTSWQWLGRCLFWGLLGAVVCAGLTFAPHVAAGLSVIFVGVKLTIGIKIGIGAAVGFLSGLGLTLFRPAGKLLWSGNASPGQRVGAFFGVLISSVFVMLLVPFFTAFSTAPLASQMLFVPQSISLSLPVKLATTMLWPQAWSLMLLLFGGVIIYTADYFRGNKLLKEIGVSLTQSGNDGGHRQNNNMAKQCRILLRALSGKLLETDDAGKPRYTAKQCCKAFDVALNKIEKRFVEDMLFEALFDSLDSASCYGIDYVDKICGNNRQLKAKMTRIMLKYNLDVARVKQGREMVADKRRERTSGVTVRCGTTVMVVNHFGCSGQSGVIKAVNVDKDQGDVYTVDVGAKGGECLPLKRRNLYVVSPMHSRGSRSDLSQAALYPGSSL